MSFDKAQFLSDPEFSKSLRKAIWPPILIGLGLFIALALLILQYHNNARWVEHTDQVISQGYKLEKYLTDMESSLRGFVISGDSHFLEPYYRVSREIDQQIRYTRNLVFDNPVQIQRIDEIERRTQNWLVFVRKVLATSSLNDAVRLIKTKIGKNQMDKIREKTEDFVQQEISFRKTRMEQTFRLGVLTLGSLVGAFLISALCLLFFTRRQFAALTTSYRKTLNQISESTQELHSAKEDLEAKIKGRTRELQLANQDLQIYQVMVQTVKDYAIFMLDNEGKILTWNSGAERTSGYQSQETIGRNFSIFYQREDILRGHPQEELRLALKNGVYEEEGYRIRKDGSSIWVNVVLTPLFDKVGVHIGFAKVLRDMSEKKRAQDKLSLAFQEISEKSEALQKSNQVANRKSVELQAANQELEAFCYSVSHDLRSPLRGIAGFAQALEEDCSKELGDRGKRYVERIRLGAQRMGVLIDDLLNLSRLTRAQMKMQPVDLSEIASSIFQELKNTDPGRTVNVQVAPHLKAEGDPGLLKAALDNLLRNAWKFTSKKSEASIEIGKEIQGTLEVFFVRDNGTGFDMAFADKLFGAFQRLHGVNEFPGTGIGLAIVRRIIHRHGGRVWVDAREGVGATFYFTLNEPEVARMAETPAA